jgi:5-formyltetrahydrofolate cyclo-ligase
MTLASPTAAFGYSKQMDKPTLRSHLLRQRRALPSAEWQQKSQQLCLHLQTCSQFIQAETVLAYFSIRQEPDLSWLFSLPKTWGFPRCVGQDLVWHTWSPHLQGVPPVGAFGIPEPPAQAPLISPEQADLILVPAVACDRRGYRLGYGGGFYDRLLAHPAWATHLTLGMTFADSHITELPIDEWDKPLRGVCTEAGVSLYSD